MKVGVALSGGGALGVAHLGVLEEIDRCVGIDLICGCSSGAIAGLLYADGGTQSIERFVVALERTGVMKTTVALLARSPTVTFETLRQVLSDSIRARCFSELNRRFSCVATDIVTGEAVVLDEGDPVPAVMASSALPGVFLVQKTAGRVMVDGGVTKNLPADVVRDQGADFVIGSSLYGNLTGVESGQGGCRLGRVKAAVRALDIMTREMTALQSRECDYCFYPPVETFRWFDIGRLDEIMELGRAYARDEICNLVGAMRRAEVHST